MSLRTNIVVKQSITAVALTGGNDTTFINDGQGTNGANVLVDSSNGNLLTRKKMTTRLTQPVAAPNPNALAKLGRADLTVHHPKVDSVSGKVYRRPANFGISFHPSDSEADRVAILLDTIAIISDPDLLPFFTKVVND